MINVRHTYTSKFWVGGPFLAWGRPNLVAKFGGEFGEHSASMGEVGGCLLLILPPFSSCENSANFFINYDLGTLLKLNLT